MTTFSRQATGTYIKLDPATTAIDFGVSTDGTVILSTLASFAAAVTTVPPRSLVFRDKNTGIQYKIPVYVSGA